MTHPFLSLGAPLLLSVAFLAAPASAQDATMKQCGEKWQAAKAAGTASGTTWPKFLSECRAKTAAADTKPMAAAPAAETRPATTAPAPKSTDAKSAEAKAPAPQPTGAIVFPTSVPAKFATLSAGRGRQKACSEQFQANKSSNANGGLKWIEKGGGYWSLCNAKLKG